MGGKRTKEGTPVGFHPKGKQGEQLFFEESMISRSRRGGKKFSRVSAQWVPIKQSGIPFVVVAFPMPEQVWNTANNVSAYQGRLQGISKKIGVPTLDLLPAFRTAVSKGESVYIPWDWHPNAKGHQVAAQAIRDFVQPVVAKRIVKHPTVHMREQDQQVGRLDRN